MQPTKLPRSARSSRRELVLGDDVADPDPPTRLEHARDLGQHRRLVDREVDHAVRDHDVDRVGRQRDLLDHALEEVRRSSTPASRGVAPREREHLVGHVQAVGDPRRADAPAPRGSRRSRRPSRDRAPSRPRAAPRPPSGCRNRATRAPPSPAARRAARRRTAPRRTCSAALAVVGAARAAAATAPVAMLDDRARRLRIAPPHLLAKVVCRRAHHRHRSSRRRASVPI